MLTIKTSRKLLVDKDTPKRVSLCTIKIFGIIPIYKHSHETDLALYEAEEEEPVQQSVVKPIGFKTNAVLAEETTD